MSRYHCDVCSVTVDNKSSWGQHRRGKKHTQRVAVLAASSGQTTVVSATGTASSALSTTVPTQCSSETPTAVGVESNDNNGWLVLDSHCRVSCCLCSGGSLAMTANDYAQHFHSNTHRVKANLAMTQGQTLTWTRRIRYICLCSPKQKFETKAAYEEHNKTNTHHRNMIARSLVRKMATPSASLDAESSSSSSHAVSSSTDIVVDVEQLLFGFVQKKKLHTRAFSLVNQGPVEHRFLRVVVLPRPGWRTAFAIEGERNVAIAPNGGKLDFTVSFMPEHEGQYIQHAIFKLQGGIEVVCRFSGAVGDAQDLDELKPTNVFKKRRYRDDFMAGKRIVHAPQITLDKSLQPRYAKSLARYPIPKELRNTLTLSPDEALAIVNPSLAPLSSSNYGRLFELMLHAEELKMEMDIQAYDMQVSMTKTPGGMFFLNVPGLAEGRPSVLMGDSVFVSELGSNTGSFEGHSSKAFEGKVHEVHQERVLLGFDRQFNHVYSSGKTFDVRFAFNRIPQRRMHQAVHKFETVAHFVFPQPAAVDLACDAAFQAIRQSLSTMTWLNSQMESNMEQKLAVAAIVKGAHGNTPFILWGPPGTGKTVTMVEALAQLYTKAAASGQHFRALVCAPSNSAADLIVTRLKNRVSARRMIRVNATSRSARTLPAELTPYCRFKGDGQFLMPNLKDLDSFSIVVATCMTSGAITALGKNAPFTHIFVDEVGQGTEPEVVIPLQLATPRMTRLILAGDPKQLGPIVRSPVARAMGLELSFLERLVEDPCGPYPWQESMAQQQGNHVNVFGVKLLNQYRAHADIIQVPNDLFYQSGLRPCAPMHITNAMLTWQDLPQQGYPVKFVGIEGVDYREGNSPSWFNPFEVAAVVKEVASLLEHTKPDGSRVRATDIGIIAPYRKQVEKIRHLLKAKNLAKHEDILVGTVEMFQGREKDIIVISTVRSTAEWMQTDTRYQLGFMSNPKRFNVAVTRARSLLVVVGNPNVLVQDPCWARLLREVTIRQGATGAPVAMQDVDGEDVVSELCRLMQEVSTDGNLQPVAVDAAEIQEQQQQQHSESMPSTLSSPINRRPGLAPNSPSRDSVASATSSWSLADFSGNDDEDDDHDDAEEEGKGADAEGSVTSDDFEVL